MQHSQRFLKIVDAAKGRIRKITVEEVRADREGGVEHVLIDTREESEWARGRASGSMHLGKGILERDIESRVPELDRRIVLYCGGGFRSALSADALQQMGYTQVFSLAGGWRAWNEAQMPVDSDD